MAESIGLVSPSAVIVHSNVPFSVPDGVYILGKSDISFSGGVNWSGFDGVYAYQHVVGLKVFNGEDEVLDSSYENLHPIYDGFGTKKKSGSKSGYTASSLLLPTSEGEFSPGDTLRLHFYHWSQTWSAPGFLSEEQNFLYDIAEWAQPQILAYAIYRATAAGVPDENGTKLRYTFSANVTPLTGYGHGEFFLRYKRTADVSWTEIPVAENVNSIEAAGVELDGDFPLNESYVFQFVAYDGYVSAVAQSVVFTGGGCMHFNANKDGVAIGKFSEGPGLDVGLDARFRGTAQFDVAPVIDADQMSAFLAGIMPYCKLSAPTAENMTRNAADSYCWVYAFQTVVQSDGDPFGILLGGAGGARKMGWVIPDDGRYRVTLHARFTNTPSSKSILFLAKFAPAWEPPAVNYLAQGPLTAAKNDLSIGLAPAWDTYNTQGQLIYEFDAEAGEKVWPSAAVTDATKPIDSTYTWASIQRIG